MDKLGIPRNSKWRALILFMRSIADYDIYSAEQKRQVQELVVHVLKERDLSDERFAQLSKKNEDILSSPWRDRLKHALADLAQAIGESRGMILKRKGEIEQLGANTVEVVQSGKDIDEVVSDIRKGFQDVVRFMEEDAENLSRMSYTDALTGLHNRRAFEETLTRAVERSTAKKTPLCVLMADVDRFKDFNDRHGHLIGDQALSAVASVLRECQRQAQERGVQLFTARYGGEEFTIVTENMGQHQAIALAEHIRHRIEAYNFVIRDVDGEILDTGVKLTISIGVGCLDPAWKGAIEQRLVNAADEALYAAKQAGRNRVMPSGG
jgi:diguanylate cyclase (GGDEF)-like protein